MVLFIDYQILIVAVISAPVRPMENILVSSRQDLGDGELFAGEIGKALSSVKHNYSIKVDLVYEDKFKDAASVLSKTLSGSVSGLKTLKYDTPMRILDQVLKNEAGTKLVIAICSSEIILQIFKTIQEKTLESHLVKWLLISNEEKDTTAIIGGLTGIIFEGTRLTVVAEISDGKPVVYSSYVDTDGVTKFLEMGSWKGKARKNSIYLQHLLTPEGNNPLDMKGRVLRIAALERMPHFSVGQLNSDGSREATGGFDLMILKTLASSFNFSFKIFEPKDGSFGNPKSDGTVSGMIGMVARREAGMAFGGITLTDVRDTVVDFSSPYHFAYMGIFSRAPKEKNRALAVMSPFTFEVWICLALVTLSIGPILFLLSWMNLKDENFGSFQNFQEYSFQMFRNLVNQANFIKPKFISQRILMMFWFIFCLINAALYSGTLTAVLAIPAFEKPIDYLEDLPKAVEDGFTICVNRDTTNEYIFRDAKGGIYKSTYALFNHKDRSESFVSGLKEGVSRILNGKYVYMGTVDKIKYLASTFGVDKFHYGKQKFFFQNLGIAIPTGAPYKEHFNRVLARIIEAGIFEKWGGDEFFKITKAGGNEESNSKAITLTHLQAAFFIVLLGYILATLTLCTENIVAFCKRQ